TAAPAELLAAVHTAAAGETPLSPAVATIVADQVRADPSRSRRAEAQGRLAALTERERGVLLEVSAGRTTEAGAARLFISPSTFRKHLDAIFAKTGVRTRVELAWLIAHALPEWSPGS